MVNLTNNYFANKKAVLVKRLIEVGVLRKQSYIDAMISVKREHFVWRGFERYTYSENALPLGETGQTIPPPHLCAYMLGALDPRVGEKILEIGTGSGYNAALITECIAPSSLNQKIWGKIITIEIVEELFEFANRNLEKAGYSNRVECILGDGTLGFPPLFEGEVYDKIVVTAGASYIPTSLINQLKTGGVMIIPIGSKHSQQLMMVIKGVSGFIEKIPLQRCEFVPLIGKYGWD